MSETIEPRSEYDSSSRVFVEIGYGSQPAFLDIKDKEERQTQFREVHYIGIEPEEDKVDEAKHFASMTDTSHMRSIGLNKGTIEDLSLKDESVDEVYIANVFAETHAEQNWDLLRSQIVSSNIHEAPGNRPFTKLVEQMEKVKRILKPDGQLTIVETNTPTELDVMTDLLDTLGFSIEKIIKKEDELEWQQMENRYHITVKMAYLEDPYIIIARKKKD